jgi:nucleotide-binding universal stress UspA family protein
MNLEEVAMHTILVPLDGSALAERVLPHVRALAPMLSARVCLLEVISTVDHDTMLNETLLEAYGIADTLEALQAQKKRAWETMRQHAEGYLAAQAMYMRETGLDVEIEVQFGSPDKMIVEVARERNATLIAMATHGYGGLKLWTLGSVTDQVVHTVATPVFVVHGAEQVPAAPTIKRILVPLDGSAFARQVLPFATELANQANAEMILLQAITSTIEPLAGFRPLLRPIPQYSELIELLHWRAQLELGGLAEQIRQYGITVRTSIVNGQAAEVILDETAQRKADLVVMATHGYSGLKRWALGSVAHKVLHTATVPLVLVRAQAVAEASITHQVLHDAVMPLGNGQAGDGEKVGIGISGDARSSFRIER